VIGIVERHSSSTRRVAGRLEEIYLQTADDLLAMLVAGAFPSTEIVTGATGTPRVGDGLIRLDDSGVVEFASPNAVSAMRRLGLATELVGADLCALLIKLSHKHGPVDEALSQVASGQVAGSADVDNGTATVLVRGIPILDREIRRGAIVLLQDATEIRRRERALMSKDATIREIHHRVKNNLQTVAALLRLQGRRAQSEETREALAEAQLRVASIAVVHESLSKAGSEDVPFEEVVDRVISLVRDLAPAYAVAGVIPSIEREGECSAIPEELVTPLAMAVSELLQNAVEHARASRIRVVISEGAGAISIDVIDDGAGLPEGFTMESAGLGLQIVESLVQNEARGAFRLMPNEGHGTLARIEVRAGR
jgi:two-component sensor histidine kinase